MSKSHYQLIDDYVASIVYKDYDWELWCDTGLEAWIVQNAAMTFGNSYLAYEEDRDDEINELRERSPNKALFNALVNADACLIGLRAVGCRARDWYMLGVLIAQDVFGDSYLEWCCDALLPHVMQEVQRGYDSEIDFCHEP